MAVGHIRSRGKGKYQILVPTGRDAAGKYRYVSRTITGTKRDAERVRTQLLSEVQQGHHGHQGKVTTVADLLRQWLATKTDYAPSTRYQTSNIIEAVVIPTIGNRAIGKVTALELDRLYTFLSQQGSKTGGPLRASTVTRVHGVIHAAFEQAVRWRLIPVNPAAHVTRRKADRLEATAPDPADVARLVAMAEASDPGFALWLRLSAITGCRRGEIAGLRWKHFDLQNKTVMIARTISYGAGAPEDRPRTKNKTTRTIAIDDRTVELLDQHMQREVQRASAAGGPRLTRESYVFSPHPGGVRPCRPDVMTRRFSRLRDRAQLPAVHLHSFRHYMATQALANGVSVRTVAERLGHANPNQTLATYAHHVPAADHEAAALMGALLPESTPQPT